MSKKKPNKSSVYHLSSVENTLRQMPKYNGYAVGHGMHGDKKYNRNHSKRDFNKMLESKWDKDDI